MYIQKARPIIAAVGFAVHSRGAISPNMYEKDKTLLLVATASAIHNNLAVKLLDPSRVAESISVVHGGYINVIPLRTLDTATSQYIPCSSDSAQKYAASVMQVSHILVALQKVEDPRSQSAAKR